MDALELRPDSRLGVTGLMECVRQGTVSVLNNLGSGVLENPALLPFLPELCERLLGQSLRLPSVETWWCGDQAVAEPCAEQSGLHRHTANQPWSRSQRTWGRADAGGSASCWRTRSRLRRTASSGRRCCICLPRQPARTIGWSAAMSCCARSPSAAARRIPRCWAAWPE